jgi:hypothetical protein
MDISPCAARKALEEIAHQFHLQISHPRCANLGIDHRSGAPTEINSRQTEGFIHGHHKITSTENSAAIPKSAIEDFAQRNPHVLNGVVLIHVQVAHRRELQIESAVPSKEIQHVVQEADPCGDLVLSSSLDRESNRDLGFSGLAMEFAFSHAVASL